MRRALTSLLVLRLGLAALHAQTPAPAPAFEAATVKPCDPAAQGRQPMG